MKISGGEKKMTEKKVKVQKEFGPTQMLVEIAREVVLWPEFDEGVSVGHAVGDTLTVRVVARGVVKEGFKLLFDNANIPELTGNIGDDGVYELEDVITIT